MPRIRSIKPEIWQSPQVMNLSRDARLLFLGLITQADDEGRGSADPRKLKSTIFPGDEDITAEVLEHLKGEIGTQRLAIFYACEEHGPLYQCLTFKRHQTINKARQSIYPAAPKKVPEKRVENTSILDDSRSTPVAVAEPYRRTTEGSDLILSEGSEGSLARARAHPTGSRGGKNGTEERDFRAEARKLANGGMLPDLIHAALSRYGVTLEQVQEWTAGMVVPHAVHA